MFLMHTILGRLSVAAITAAAVGLSVTGCGQRGPLYLPTSAETPPPSAPAASAPVNAPRMP